jgi:hypothetical protein
MSYYDPDMSDGELVEHLRQELGKKRNIKHLRSAGEGSFLSVTVLETVGRLHREFAQLIAEQYKTVGAFCRADPDKVASQTGAGEGSIKDAKGYLARHFKLEVDA